MPDLAVLVVAGVFGSMIGSFLNVVIHRLPDRKSLAWPGSACPACAAPIGWYDNLPILSWLILRGRCRACRDRISARYLLVEVLTSALTVVVAARYLTGERDWPMCVATLCLTYALVPVTFIDLKLKIIPDAITKPGMILAPILSMVAPGLHRTDLIGGLAGRPQVAALLLSLTGMAAGAGVIWLMGVAGKVLFKKDSMGFGDVKLMGMVGGFTGPVGVLMVILLACVLGSVIGVVSYVFTRSHYIPFGPFLSAGALLTLFFRPEIVHFLTVTYPSFLSG